MPVSKKFKTPLFFEARYEDIAGPWSLPYSPIWTPTEPEYLQIGQRNEKGIPRTIKGLVVDAIGRIYGWRSMSEVYVDAERGVMVGRVNLGGVKRKAHTHSLAFFSGVDTDPSPEGRSIVRVEVLMLRHVPKWANGVETGDHGESGT